MEVILGLGSNLGNRLENLRNAIWAIKKGSTDQFRITRISPIYESEALLPAQHSSDWNLPYFNLNLMGESSLSPEDLLAYIKTIERNLGRQNRERWAPREIDIDILMMGSLEFRSETLQIPHPGLWERPFAYLPLLDLMPGKMPRGTSPFKYHVQEGAKRSGETFSQLMGILNLTPDSFSDGGSYRQEGALKKRIDEFLERGIFCFDLGAESTRPGATPVSSNEEWSRLEPALNLLTQARSHSSYPITVSVDTRNPKTAARAAQNGADWINDVTGLSQPEMVEVGKKFPVQFVIMHSLTVPPSQAEVLPKDQDPVAELLKWADLQIRSLEKEGINRDRILIDPGIGFGKTPEQSWEILRNCRRFQSLGVRTLVGHSRKSFFKTGIQTEAKQRDLETAIVSVELARAGVDFIRIHDPDTQKRALSTWAKLDGVVRF